jgi:hypothetical protein
MALIKPGLLAAAVSVSNKFVGDQDAGRSTAWPAGNPTWPISPDDRAIDDGALRAFRVLRDAVGRLLEPAPCGIQSASYAQRSGRH